MQGLLLKPITKIRNLIVDPCLEEEEPYSIRSRKLAVIAFVIITSNVFFMGIPVVVITVLFDPNLGTYLTAGFSILVFAASSVVPYVHLRRTRKLPDWVVDLQIWSTTPTLLCFSLFIHHTSVIVACSITILIGVVVRVRGWYILVLFGACINVLHAMINDFSDELPQLYSTFHTSQLLSIRIMGTFGSSIAPFILFALGLHMIMKESVERANQADAAIAMNLAVADKLRRYDTDGVAVILAAHKGQVDEKLLEAFTAIQHNLQEYRPHIPDYVIAATIGTEDGVDYDDDDDEGALKESSYKSRFSATRSDRPGSRSRSSSRVVGGGLLSLSRSGVESMGSAAGEGEENSEIIVAKSQKLGSIKTPIEIKSHQDEESSSDNTWSRKVQGESSKKDSNYEFLSRKSNKQRQHFHGRATTVFVRFISGDCRGSNSTGHLRGSIPKSSAPAAMRIVSMCVDAASKHAKVHHGALQYMQGCGLMVSFNAASRVATHEANACAFALALKMSVEELLDSDLVMHATIVTTNVLSFFAGNSGQLMLTVLGGFMPVHTAMHHYLSQTVGKAASCVLLDETIVPTVEMIYDQRLLGGIARTPHSHLPGSPLKANNPVATERSFPSFKVGDIAAVPGTHNEEQQDEFSTVCELLSAKAQDEDEWLYRATERDANDPISLVNKAVQAALDGDIVSAAAGAASGYINDHTHHQWDSSDIVLIKCVKERLEAFTTAGQGSGSSPTTSSSLAAFEVRCNTATVMW